MMLRLAWASAAIVSLIAGAPCGAQPASARALAFDFTTHQPIIPVSINGHRAVPFLFDTGASINIVGQAIAEEMGLAGSGPSTTIAGGGQTAVGVRYVDGVTLAADGIAWTGQRVGVVPIGAKQFAGFVGAPILMQYVVEIDFQRQVLRLIDPDDYVAPPGALRIPFELQANLPVVRAEIDAGSGPLAARLMVDTGAGSVFVDLNRPFVDRHKLVDVLAGTSSDRPAGIGGSAPFIYATGKQARLGRETFDRPRLGLSRAIQGSSAGDERDGVIGNQLLRSYLTAFDYRRRELVLQRQR
jgi:hypothetical protein